MKRIRRAINFLGDEEKKYNIANKDLERFENLWIITDANTVDDIRSISKAMRFDIVIIDYMQLVKPADRYKGNRAGEVAEISGDLKRMAKELNCHVILLSQLNRKTEEQKEPTMAELRESGAIEQDASNILLLWTLSRGIRDGKTKEERCDQKGIRVCKCRQGELGGAVFYFDGANMFFEETNLNLDEVSKFHQAKEAPMFVRPGKEE
jgi:replicative DNA helicase